MQHTRPFLEGLDRLSVKHTDNIYLVLMFLLNAAFVSRVCFKWVFIPFADVGFSAMNRLALSGAVWWIMTRLAALTNRMSRELLCLVKRVCGTSKRICLVYYAHCGKFFGSAGFSLCSATAKEINDLSPASSTWFLSGVLDGICGYLRIVW